MKNILKALLLILGVVLSSTSAQAQVITAERAKEIANTFFASGAQKSAAARTMAVQEKSLDNNVLSEESNDNEAPTYHVLTAADGKGFIIVSGEEIENPIIGYSFDSEFITDGEQPAGLVDYLANIDAEIRALRLHKTANPQKAAAARSTMQKTNYNATTMGEQVVLLETAKWGQSAPFNAQCWTTAAHTEQALTGCVPTAFAIIMRYHEWPIVGTGAIQDCQDAELPYTYYDNRTYDYSKMPLVYDSNWTEEQKNEVAKLMSHLGHAFGVSYGTGSTSVTMGNSLTTATKTYFNYQACSISNQYNNGSLTDFTEWKNNLKNSLDNNCPVPYGANNIGSGTVDARHMFVVDGYTDDDYFHFNFGWNGGSNGWYKLDAITVGYSWSDDANGYTSKHQAFFNLTPNKTQYPVTATVDPENAGTVTVNPAEQVEGGIVTLTATANTGYTFQNWTKGGEVVSTNKSCTVKVASSDNDYVANFLTVGNTTVNVQVTYNSSYGTVKYNDSAVSGTGITPYQNAEFTLTAEPVTGYVFSGWTVTKGTESTNYSGTSLTLVATSEMSVTANFALAAADYIISPSTTDVTGSSKLSIVTYQPTTENPAALTLKATSTENTPVDVLGISRIDDDRFRLYAYATNAEGNTSYTTVKYTLTAPDGYIISKYSFDYSLNSTAYPCTITYDNGKTITPSDTEWYSLSVTVNAQTAEFTLTTTTSHTSSNFWTRNFTVSLEKDGAGSGAPATQYTITATANPENSGTVTGGGTYNEGATVTLTATPNSGYEFVNWTSGTTTVSTNATYSFTANASAEYVANFQTAAATTFAVTTTANPVEGGTAKFAVGTGSQKTQGDVNNNEEITLYAVANDGYRFVNWTKGGMEVSTNATHNVTITEASNFVANFEANAQEPAAEYPTPTGNTYTDNYLTSITTTGGDTNIGYSANAHPGQSLVVVPGKVQLAKGDSFTMNLVAYSLGAGSSSTQREDMRYCHASLFTDFDQDFTFEASPVQTWGVKGPSGTNPYAGGNSHVYGNYDLVMNITHTITVPDDAPTGESHVRMIYTNAWTNWPANGTAELDKGIVYDIVVEVVEKVDITATATNGTVTINGEATATKRVIKGSSVTLNATPSEGYLFVNWKNGEDVVSETAEYTFTANGATTLTANFQKKSYTITAAANPAEGGTATVAVGANPGTNEIIVEHGGMITLTAAENTGYNFVEWRKNGEFFSNQQLLTVNNIDDAANYVANFQKESYTVSVEAGEGGTATVSKGTSPGASEVTVEYGGSATISATPANGYRFVNWTKDGNETSTDATVVVENITAAAHYVANFELIPPTTYTITAAANPAEGGTATVAVGASSGSSSVVVAEGGSITLTAAANAGYSFVEWRKNGEFFSNQAGLVVEGINSNADYVAYFTESSYTIATTANFAQGGEATVSIGNSPTTSVTASYGDYVTLYATPADGYNFVNWTKDGNVISTNATYNVPESVTGNATYVANFAIGEIFNATFEEADWGTPVDNYTDRVVTADTPSAPAITIAATEGKKIGSTTVGSTQHPYLLNDNSFTITVEGKRIKGYILTVIGLNFNGTFTYTTAPQMARSSNGIATVGVSEPVTVSVSGLDTDEINIGVSAGEQNSGIIVLDAQFDYVEEPATDELDGKWFRIKCQSGYMNIANNTEHPAGTTGGVNVIANKTLNNHSQVFYFTKSGDGYKLKSKSGYYITCQPWNVDAYNTEDGTVLSFESTGNDNEYYIKWDNKHLNNGNERDDYFKTQAVNYSTYVFCDAAKSSAAIWTLEEVTYSTIITEVNPQEGGTANATFGTTTAASVEVENGSSVTLTATANEGYVFSHWSKGGETVPDAGASYVINNVTEGGTYTANFSKKNYTVSVSANPGNAGNATVAKGTSPGAASVEVEHGSSVTLTATANDGYTFVNWTKDGNVVSNAETYVVNEITASAQYVANFELIQTNSYTITASANPNNGGTATVAIGLSSGSNSVNVEEGGEVVLTAAENIGYEFVNWTKDGNIVSTDKAFTVNNIIANADYVANFSKKNYTVSVSANLGTAGNATVAKGTSPGAASVEVEHGSSVTLTATANDGYEFAGWYNGVNKVSDANPYIINNVTENISYTAIFEKENTGATGGEYIVVYENGKEQVTGRISEWAYNFNNEYPAQLTLKATNATGTPVNAIVMSNDRLLAGAYDDNYIILHTPVTYTLSIENDGYYIVGYSIKYQTTNNHVITIKGEKTTQETDGNKNTSYTFNEENLQTKTTEFTMSAEAATVNHSITFSEFIVYIASSSNTISVEAGNGGTASVAKGTGTGIGEKLTQVTVDSGDSVTLFATPDEGYQFVNWTLNGTPVSNNASCEISNVTTNRHYVANFARKTYTISASTNNANGGSATVSNGTVEHGGSVTLTAHAEPGYAFEYWTRNGERIEGAATLNVTNITENAQYVAYFIPTGIYYTVTTTVTTQHGDNGGTINGPVYVNPGENATIIATANTGYRFVAWYDEQGNKVSENATYTVENVTADATYRAEFIKQIYIRVRTLTNGYAVVYIDMGDETMTNIEGYFDYGSMVTIKAYIVNQSEDVFAYWSFGGEKQSQDAEFTFEATDEWECVRNTHSKHTANECPHGTSCTEDHILEGDCTDANCLSCSKCFIGTFNYKAAVAVESANDSNGSVYIETPGTTFKEMATGNSVTITAQPKSGYAFDYWTLKNDANSLSYSSSYTLVLNAAPRETVTYVAHFRELTQLENGKAYRIVNVSGTENRYIHRNNNGLTSSTNAEDGEIFVAQEDFVNGGFNLISAVGDYGWQYDGTLGNEYATIKTTSGVADGTFTLYSNVGTECYTYKTNSSTGEVGYYHSATGNVITGTDTDFIFEEVPFTFNVNIANGSNAKLGTINLPFATYIHPSVTVYGVFDTDENSIYLNPIALDGNVLPANTPVLIEAEEAGTYGFTPAPAPKSKIIINTGLEGTLAAETIDAGTNAYILSYDGPGTRIKMYKLAADSRRINANKAYYVDTTGRASALEFKFVGTTGVDDVEREGIENTIYDLKGRRLTEITEPGMYIINGKKVYKK